MQSDTKTASIIDRIEPRIREFLTAQFLFEFDAQVNEDTDLFKEGLVDSFGYVQLIQFLEKEFQIKFEDEELVSYQLNTVRTIASMVHKKLSVTGDN